MKTVHIPAIMIIFIAGLSPLMGQKSVYSFSFDNDFRLPAMDTRIDREEIAASYQTMGNLYTAEITGIGEEKVEQTSMSYMPDVKAVDAVRFLEYYMKQQLVMPGDETMGLVEMSIIYFQEKDCFNAGSLLGVLTFGIGTLLGIPYSTTVTDVEIEASFYNADERLISVHRGVGRSKKWQTVFNNSTREAHQKALRKALGELNDAIMEDSLLMAARLPLNAAL
jgi:hypothetical protein